MKNLLLCFLLCSMVFTACKKSSDNPAAPTSNYFMLNNDSRQLGDVPSENVTVAQTAYVGDIQLAIEVTGKTDSLAGRKNITFGLNIFIDPAPTANNEYTIVDMAQPPASCGSLYITMISEAGDYESLTAESGKIYITRDSNDKVTLVKFDNVVMKDQKGTINSYIKIN